MKRFGYLLLFLVLLSTVYGLTPEERVYFDSQNDKLLAQVNARLDQKATAFEDNMLKEVEASTRFIEEQTDKGIKKAVKALGIGMAGAIFIILGLFRIIDTMMTRTKIIQKYEEKLKKEIKEVKEYKKNLDQYKSQLVSYAKGQGFVYKKESTVKKKFPIWIFYIIGGLLLSTIIFFIIRMVF